MIVIQTSGHTIGMNILVYEVHTKRYDQHPNQRAYHWYEQLLVPSTYLYSYVLGTRSCSYQLMVCTLVGMLIILFSMYFMHTLRSIYTVYDCFTISFHQQLEGPTQPTPPLHQKRAIHPSMRTVLSAKEVFRWNCKTLIKALP